ncbi:hypothetical protein [Leptospira brenneri]|uniref:hypothetical protein n=1 Tax=Leptospira brenneri TaxID=2023182 RepID=UPI0013FE0E19|nr:hypothetical protein [Leptospira brenneri]
MAKLYASQGFVHSLPWPELGIQSVEFTDYHFLIHLTQIPFTLLPLDENVKIKLYIFFTLAFLLFQLFRYFESIGFKNSYYFLGVWFVLGSTLFTGRLLFGRGNVILFAILFLALRLWNDDKHKFLFGLGFLSVWAYSGFPLLFIVFGLLCLADWSRNKRRNYSFLLLGIMSGLVIHPSFPNQWSGYFLELIIQSFPPPAVEPIAEWLPPTKELLFLGFFPILPLLGITFLQLKKRKMNSPSIVFLFLAIISLIIAGASLRVFEASFLFFFLFLFHNIQLSKNLQILSVIFLILLQLPITYKKNSDHFKTTNPKLIFATTEWIKRNIPPKERIFLSWADYPYFTYKNPEYTYLFGLNPLYAWAKNPELYLAEKNFFDGSVNGFQMIPQILGYKVVIINKQFYPYSAETFGKLNKNYSLDFQNEKYNVYIFTKEAAKTTIDNNIIVK